MKKTRYYQTERGIKAKSDNLQSSLFSEKQEKENNEQSNKSL
jgi:hypothetical protein